MQYLTDPETVNSEKIETIRTTVLRRHTGEMNSIMFAKNYLVCKTAYDIVHWVHVDKIKRLQEKLLKGTQAVHVLFCADGLNFEVVNVDVIQFLAEVYLAREIGDERPN